MFIGGAALSIMDKIQKSGHSDFLTVVQTTLEVVNEKLDAAATDKNKSV
jgi:hypothetical protein